MCEWERMSSKDIFRWAIECATARIAAWADDSKQQKRDSWIMALMDDTNSLIGFGWRLPP